MTLLSREGIFVGATRMVPEEWLLKSSIGVRPADLDGAKGTGTMGMDTPYRYRKGSSGASGRGLIEVELRLDGKGGFVFSERRPENGERFVARGRAETQLGKRNALLLNSVGLLAESAAMGWRGTVKPAVGSGGGKSTRLDLQWKGGLWGAIERSCYVTLVKPAAATIAEMASLRGKARAENSGQRKEEEEEAQETAIPIAEGFLRSKWLLHRPREAEPWTNDKLLNFACDPERDFWRHTHFAPVVLKDDGHFFGVSFDAVQHPRVVCSARLNLTPVRDGDRAGVMIRRDRSCWITAGLTLRKGKIRLTSTVTSGSGWSDHVQLPFTRTRVKIRIYLFGENVTVMARNCLEGDAGLAAEDAASSWQTLRVAHLGTSTASGDSEERKYDSIVHAGIFACSPAPAESAQSLFTIAADDFVLRDAEGMSAPGLS